MVNFGATTKVELSRRNRLSRAAMALPKTKQPTHLASPPAPCAISSIDPICGECAKRVDATPAFPIIPFENLVEIESFREIEFSQSDRIAVDTNCSGDELVF